MFDPFLQPVPTAKHRHNGTASEELAADINRQSVDASIPRLPVGLWIGRLLIKIGEKLTGQDLKLKGMREHS